MRLSCAALLAGMAFASGAHAQTYHTKSIDNISCNSARIAAVILDQALGHQRIPEPDLQAFYSQGECLGTDPSVPFQLVSVETIPVFDRKYRIATVRFIPMSAGQMTFINYIPFSQIERR